MESEEAGDQYFSAPGEQKELEDVCDEVCKLQFNETEGETETFVLIEEDSERQCIKTNLRLCRTEGCEGCKNLHLCKSYLFGECPCDNERDECLFSHDLYSEHNVGVLCQHKLLELDCDELCVTLLQNDTTLLPQVCSAYNEGGGEFGNCPKAGSCKHLHVCEDYIRGTCDGCSRCHDLYEPHPAKTLQDSGVPGQLMDVLLLIYKNMLTIADMNKPNIFSRTSEKWICLLHFRNSCDVESTCEDAHFFLPYKWEERNGPGWDLLPDHEEVEKAFCDPANTHSLGIVPVHFDTMTRGCLEVRRLSTISAVLDPSFALTTTWIWYCEKEDGTWVQYGSSKKSHDMSSITSENLEWKYQENCHSVIKFAAAGHSYEINMQDMMQYNKEMNTTMRVRRRPMFLSAEDVQKIIAREMESKDHQAVPCDPGQANTTAAGLERILLNSHSEEHKKVLKHFYETMSEFKVKSIEKVLNKDLWEAFQRYVNVMKEKDKGKENEKRLFHGTRSEHVDTICKQNIDWKISARISTPYGKGSYFTKDAKSSHDFTDTSGTRCMFLCRVCVGEYTNGNPSYSHPPLKDGKNGIYYDSCVNNMNNPSVFVVFEKPQVYPEFLIRYEPGARIGPPLHTSLINQARFSAPSQSSQLSNKYYSPQFRYNYNALTSAPIAASLMAPVFHFPNSRFRSPFFPHPNRVSQFPFSPYYRPFLARNFTVGNPTRPQKRQGGFGPLCPAENFVAQVRAPASVRMPTARHHGSNFAKSYSGFSPGSAFTGTSGQPDYPKSVRSDNPRAKRASRFNSRAWSSPEVQSMRPEGKSFNRFDIQSTNPESQTSRSSTTLSAKPESKTSRSSAAQSTKPEGKSFKSSATQSTKPAGNTSRSSEAQSAKPAGMNSRSSASQSTKPAGTGSKNARGRH
ncbi:zinc finger CCCH type domain containing 1-like [Silurus meridionalis]|nr:zinc finger CCCH type domain containing 1-like [Silurus meridionalis]